MNLSLLNEGAYLTVNTNLTYVKQTKTSNLHVRIQYETNN